MSDTELAPATLERVFARAFHAAAGAEAWRVLPEGATLADPVGNEVDIATTPAPDGP